MALAAGDQPAAARCALGFAYVWYNFMPLARGTAVVGYITLLAVFLAAGMPITAPIPEARTGRSAARAHARCLSRCGSTPLNHGYKARPGTDSSLARAPRAELPGGLGGHPVARAGALRRVGVALAVPARCARAAARGRGRRQRARSRRRRARGPRWRGCGGRRRPRSRRGRSSGGGRAGGRRARRGRPGGGPGRGRAAARARGAGHQPPAPGGAERAGHGAHLTLAGHCASDPKRAWRASDPGRAGRAFDRSQAWRASDPSWSPTAAAASGLSRGLLARRRRQRIAETLGASPRPSAHRRDPRRLWGHGDVHRKLDMLSPM